MYACESPLHYLGPVWIALFADISCLQMLQALSCSW